MDEIISFREMKVGDEKAVSDLVIRTFNKFIAPGYSDEGIREFLKCITPEAILYAQRKDLTLTLVATLKEEIIGVMMVRIRDHSDHISLLFVDEKYHRRGVARELLRKALEIRQGCDPFIKEITVNSSPYAVPIYGKLGFQQVQPEQIENGIRFTPMVLKL